MAARLRRALGASRRAPWVLVQLFVIAPVMMIHQANERDTQADQQRQNQNGEDKF